MPMGTARGAISLSGGAPSSVEAGNTFDVTVTMENAGGNVTGLGSFDTSFPSDPRYQQGFNVHKRMTGPPDSIHIVDKDMSTYTVRDGYTFSLDYQVYSPSDTPGWLGCSVFAPDGTEVTDTTHEGPGHEITFLAGTHWYGRPFYLNLPPSPQSGLYDVRWSVHWDNDNMDVVTEEDQLTVEAPLAVRVPILMYHEVAPTAHTRYYVTTDMFRAHMEALKAYGYTAITLKNLMDYRAGLDTPPTKPLIITIDDAYENLLFEAYPVLSDPDIAFNFTCFVPTGRVGGDNSWNEGLWDTYPNAPVINHLDWQQIESLDAGGLADLQSHSVTHSVLTELSEADLRYELAQSKQDLEDHLGKVVEFFSYPYGAFSSQVKEELRAAGYFAGVGAWGGMEPTSANKYQLRRILIDWNTTISYDPAYPEDFLFSSWKIDDPEVSIPEITVTSIDYLDAATHVPLDGNALRQGEVVLVRVTAGNTGEAAAVVVSLNIDSDDNPDNGIIYDSHQVAPSEDWAGTFGVETLQFDWTWYVPFDAPPGPYRVAAGFHDQHGVLDFEYSGWREAFSVMPTDLGPPLHGTSDVLLLVLAAALLALAAKPVRKGDRI